MEILTWVAGIPLCLMLGITGIFKTTNQKVSIETRDRIGVSPGLWTAIGAAEATAMGLIIAATVNNWKTVGTAVAAGVVALMIGAIGYHAKANDIKAAYVGPIFVLVLAALYIIGMSQR